jgi:hypothetical protein
MRSATVRMDDGTDGQMDGWMGWMENFMKTTRTSFTICNVGRLDNMIVILTTLQNL